MNSAIVNPTPPSQPAPCRCRHVVSAGAAASPLRTASQAAIVTPSGLPTASPSTIPSDTGPASSASASAWKGTPAFASANSGITTNATHGRSACSIRRAGARTPSQARSSECTASSRCAASSAASNCSRTSSLRARKSARSIRARAGIAVASSRPAIVACTPEWKNSTQRIAPNIA